MKKIFKAWSLDLRSKSARAQRLGRNIRNFELLLGDLESMEDQLQGNVRLYTVTGDPDDPEVRFTGNIPTNFPLGASLQAAYDAETITVDDTVLGFALAGTAVRHLTFQEYLQREPDMLKRILQKSGLAEQLDDKDFSKTANALMEKYYETQILPQLPPPPMMPPNMRVRATVVSVLMKDGLSFVIHSNAANGRPVDLEAIDRDAVTENDSFNALYQFLHGVRPEQTDDPFERVQEFAVLKHALEGVSPEENGR